MQHRIIVFDVNFSKVERHIEFSPTFIVDAFRKLFRGNWFSLSRENAFYKFIIDSAPRIKDSEINYQSVMEQTLERMIYDYTKSRAGNIFGEEYSNFIQKYNDYISYRRELINEGKDVENLEKIFLSENSIN